MTLTKEEREEKEKLLEKGKKKCSKCGEIKEIGEFHRSKQTKDGLKCYCAMCRSTNPQKTIELQQLKQKNLKRCPDCKEIKETKEFYISNEKISTYCILCTTIKNTKYQKNIIESLKEYRKRYRKNNKEKKNKTEKKLREKNREKYYLYGVKYREQNKEKIRIRQNEWEKEKKLNPCFRLRKKISSSVYSALRIQNGSKNGGSILDCLPYTIEELKAHLESQFEPWMSWENHGNYNKDKPTWQLDHKYFPQSLYPYDSMDHPNFLKVWNLENLQPLEAIENIRKSNKLIYDLPEENFPYEYEYVGW
jgi:hypothetical protein